MPADTLDFFRGAFYALALGLLGWAVFGEVLHGLIG